MSTTVTARGIAPVKAIVEYLTATQCRLRAIVLLDRSETIEFEVNLPGDAPMTLQGRVTSCTSKPPRFVYTVSLDVMAPRKIDELARKLAASHRLEMSRLRDVASLDELPTTDGLTRKRPRLQTEFALQYRTAAEPGKTATASDISTSGLRMVCRDALVEGELLELRFTLPSDALEALPEETAVLDVRGEQRRVVPARLRRPFIEMVVRANVVFHNALADGSCTFGLEFSSLDRFAHDEIARYVEAIRYARQQQLRNSA